MSYNFRESSPLQIDELQEFYDSNHKLIPFLDKDSIERKPFDDDFISFTLALSKSIRAYYKLNNKIFENAEINYNDSRFYAFYVDFIASAPSAAIFTEVPRQSIYDPFPIDSVKIYNLAKLLLELTISYKKDVVQNEKFNRIFQDYFLSSFAYYDFIFSVGTNEGMFSKFRFNSNLFRTIKENIVSMINSDKNIKEISVELPSSVVKKTIKYFGHDIESAVSVPGIYDKYIKIQKEQIEKDEDIIEFEIFSYVLAKKVWKFERIFQRTPEYVAANKRKKSNYAFETKTKKYIKDTLDTIESFYNNEINYRDMMNDFSKTDQEYIKNYLFTDLLENIVTRNETFRNKITVLNEKTYIHDAGDLNLNGIISKMIRNGENEKFKFYYLFEEADYSEIAKLLQATYDDLKGIISNKNIENNYCLIGILRSGSFLAHAMNFMRQYESGTGWTYFVITHPYLSILPRAIAPRENEDESPVFIYLDEAIKSGYSVSITDLYRKRILELNNKKKNSQDFAYSLVEFFGYNKKDLDFKNYSLSTIVYKQSDLVVGEKVLEEPQNIFPWKTVLESLPEINSDDMKTMAKIKIPPSEGNERYDFVRVLADSMMLFQICNAFAKNMIKNINTELQKENKKIDLFFFYGSPEGKLMADVSVFILKAIIDNKTKSKLSFHLSGKNINLADVNKYISIFFDISIIGGSTRNRIYEIDGAGLNNQKGFDYTYVIFNEQKNDDTIYSII